MHDKVRAGMRVLYAFGPCRSLLGRRGRVSKIDSNWIGVAWDGVVENSFVRASSLKQLEDTVEQSTNPKDAIGRAKVDLSLIPAPALMHEAAAFMDGAEKYGPYNWRDNSVAAMVYVAASMRHINQWVSGETAASDSLVHHLGHARACLGIILDAIAAGKLVDDRPKAVDITAIMEGIVLARGVAAEKKK